MEKTFDASEAEARIYAKWEHAGAFRAGANASSDETFSIMIPPPNVTGVLHMGHAFNNTLQDILIRWHRMRGHDTLWQPGQDHAGIATQMVVERMLAETQQPSRREMGREAFTAKVWEWKKQSGGTIIEQLKRLGASCDWSRNAFTMSGAPGAPEGEEGNFHDAVIRVFVKMYEDGLIYRGKRLVNWDPHFETAISDLEVENIEVDGHMWHFKYPLAGGATYEYVEKDEDGKETLRETRDYISIATTRPETMLGDGAVAVHPSDERYAPIVGKLCEIPVGPKELRRLIPIITDEYPDPEFGSGAVKITGAHDFNDYAVARRGGIPMYRLMDTKGAMRDDGAPYAEMAKVSTSVAKGERELTEAEADTINLVPDDLRGLDRFEARKKVIDQITAEGLAVMTNADDPRLGKIEAFTLDPKEMAKVVLYGPSVTGRDVLDFETPQRFSGVSWESARKYAGQYYFESLATSSSSIVPNILDEEVDGASQCEALGFDSEGRRSIGLWPAMKQLVPLVEAKKIMAPYGDRSKVVIEPMLTDQWFVDTAKIVGPALEAVRDGTVEILPEQHKKVYFNWLENIEPWCISRQLWWGHQIPVWTAQVPTLDGQVGTWTVRVGANISAEKAMNFRREYSYDEEGLGGKLTQGGILTMEFCAASAEEAKEQVRKVWMERKGVRPEKLVEVASEPDTWPLSPHQEDDYFNIPMWRDPDVLDTWFSSGLWPIGTLGWPEDTPELRKYFPTSVLITGFDIIFFWVARMMMMQYAVVGERPFDTVYVHALVRDEKGKKMSKSLGNVLDPLELIDEFGADAVRFTLTSMAAMGRDLKLSTQRIAGYRNFTTKIWNAARFAEMNGVFGHARWQPGQPLSETANKWIVGEVARARVETDAALDAFRFNDAANGLYAFAYTFFDWYVEFSKPLLDGEAATETRAVYGWALDQLLIMLHPFMPFLTEELWDLSATRAKMLIYADWPDYGPELVDEAAVAEMRWVRDLIEKVRSVRGEMNVPKSLQAPLLKLSLDAAGEAAWARNEAIILKDREAGIGGLTAAGAAPKGAATIAVDGGTFALPLEGLIDVGAEAARLAKSVGKLEKELGGLQGRLNNPKFREHAAPEVIEETEDLAAQKTEELTRLKTAVERLAELG